MTKEPIVKSAVTKERVCENCGEKYRYSAARAGSTLKACSWDCRLALQSGRLKKNPDGKFLIGK